MFVFIVTLMTLYIDWQHELSFVCACVLYMYTMCNVCLMVFYFGLFYITRKCFWGHVINTRTIVARMRYSFIVFIGLYTYDKRFKTHYLSVLFIYSTINVLSCPWLVSVSYVPICKIPNVLLSRKFVTVFSFLVIFVNVWYD